MSDIQIDIERTGFPVKVGEIELWFDSSHENLVNFFNIVDRTQEEVEKSEDELRNIEIPEDYLNNLSTAQEESSKFIEHQKKLVAISYDLMFGKGTFKKIYKKYPDYLSLERALVPLNKLIWERIDQQEKDRAKAFDDETEVMLREKAKKQANKK
ncbi:hypothetical protein [Oceanobacillus oncorhynchi]|uniref:hypothetical protein n=1 Tax=Oceanobacillus oncorhynchi TaxID=545501 RepID=UPI001867E2E1|nr:hypothetical protein [Oceanobacillus oncorhynchi]